MKKIIFIGLILTLLISLKDVFSKDYHYEGGVIYPDSLSNSLNLPPAIPQEFPDYLSPVLVNDENLTGSWLENIIPDVITLPDFTYCVAYSDCRNDGSEMHDIFIRKFDRLGSPLTPSYRVNTNASFIINKIPLLKYSNSLSRILVI